MVVGAEMNGNIISPSEMIFELLKYPFNWVFDLLSGTRG